VELYLHFDLSAVVEVGAVKGLRSCEDWLCLGANKCVGPSKGRCVPLQ
jgi:hypothetical protein